MNLRFLENVSEGGAYKFRAPAEELLANFKKRLSEDSGFATDSDLEDFKELAGNILPKSF